MTHKIALITGASRGLGRSAALELARRGVNVVLTFNSQHKHAAAVVTEIEALGQKAVALQLDTSRSSGFADFVGRLRAALKTTFAAEHIDFLINNAGIGVNASLADTTEQQFDQLVDIHLKGVYFLTQKLLPLLVDGGRILNVSSGLTRFAMPGYGAYAAMKGAVEVLSRYWAKELGGRGITVNTLAPGAIETDFGGGAVRDHPDLNAMIAQQTALGRVGLPDDIGNAMAAFLTEHNGWINGQRIEASGGMLL